MSTFDRHDTFRLALLRKRGRSKWTHLMSRTRAAWMFSYANLSSSHFSITYPKFPIKSQMAAMDQYGWFKFPYRSPLGRSRRFVLAARRLAVRLNIARYMGAYVRHAQTMYLIRSFLVVGWISLTKVASSAASIRPFLSSSVAANIESSSASLARMPALSRRNAWNSLLVMSLFIFSFSSRNLWIDSTDLYLSSSSVSLGGKGTHDEGSSWSPLWAEPHSSSRQYVPAPIETATHPMPSWGAGPAAALSIMLARSKCANRNS
mmetsp:Transcript_5222/g.14800  ORF Transcript_5222/g.14800 Transcript_5222/m.14800 type:complete len:262 (-) Transcript_5222:271-1056(-)